MYRVWNKKKKCWLNKNTAIMPDGSAIILKEKKYFGIVKRILKKIKSQYVVIQKNIMLADKNNNSIYEGDIVEFETDNNIKHIGIVVYVPTNVGYYIIDFDEMKCYSLFNEVSDKIMVIGNIFENEDIVKVNPDIVLSI